MVAQMDKALVHLDKRIPLVAILLRLHNKLRPSRRGDDPDELKWHQTKGVILVSEAFTEINAGLVIVLASGHSSPIPEADLADPDRDPDELATLITLSYHETRGRLPSDHQAPS